MNYATDFNIITVPEITEHKTAFPQFAQYSELQIILTGTGVTQECSPSVAVK